MNEMLIDGVARARFRDEWENNFAVSANAGSGKTTAISERLAAMAMSAGASEVLPKTAVVTFTKKAAQQIGHRARAVLLKRLTEGGHAELSALDHLERAFFGTIHSFCLLLAQRYGQTLGINLNPQVIAEEDEAQWEAFLEQDAMEFSALTPEQVAGFLRHAPLEAIFGLARGLEAGTAAKLLARRPAGEPPALSETALQAILDARSRGKMTEALKRNQDAAVEWKFKYIERNGYLPLAKPEGSAGGMVELYAAFFAPLKAWLADAGAALAAELAERYRVWRFERGVQTYADQIESAMAVLRDAAILEKIRAEGWRVILDEAQDTDPQQFAVLVEIARAPGEPLGAWPARGGRGPRAGHFCMVGDAQQAIYGSRADIRNFTRHIEAFRRGDGGELLEFSVTFRTPHRVIEFLNAGFPGAFGEAREHNVGLPPAEGAPAPVLQVAYQPLAAGPGNEVGRACRLVLETPGADPGKVGAWLAEEARQLGTFLAAHGPAGVGAANWGEVCVLAPRNDWLVTVRKALEAAGLKVALQMRKNRSGDNPVYAWMTGLLAALCDPDNAFEWFGVLREIFGVSDAVLAAELREKGAFRWDEPADHVEPLRGALEVLRPWVLRVDDEGGELVGFASELAATCGLREKARRLDASGGLEGELERLLAEAATLGLEGAGPREWLRHLTEHLDDGRPAGKPESDAINLLTVHSAKGLEWPVVIAAGLWRAIGTRTEPGLRLITDAGSEPRVFFDGESLPEETSEARQREHRRELVRLLYVALTRARSHLVIPWSGDFGGKRRQPGISFGALWGETALLESLPALVRVSETETEPGADTETDTGTGRVGAPEGVRVLAKSVVGGVGIEVEKGKTGSARTSEGGDFLEGDGVMSRGPAGALPSRLLPHQLASKPDWIRTAREDSSLEEWGPVRDNEEAIAYGLWWHETMEFMPWSEGRAACIAFADAALKRAVVAGCEERAKEELALFFSSELFAQLCSGRWTKMAEVAVFASVGEGAWIDGVIDLVMHDSGGAVLWIVDWKTNHRRRGETDAGLLGRLTGEYAEQLRAYGKCAKRFLGNGELQLWIYATAGGKTGEIAAG